MAQVVLLRAVNVGGHNKFKPSLFAKELAHLRVASVGAAGTFIVQAEIRSESLRNEILQRLPFEPHLMISPAVEIIRLVQSKPFGDEPPDEGVKWYVSVLANPPRIAPRLPIERPTGGGWAVKVFKVTGRYALSLWRRQGSEMIYPNEVVEKELGVFATTRGWNTMTSVCRKLEIK